MKTFTQSLLIALLAGLCPVHICGESLVEDFDNLDRPAVDTTRVAKVHNVVLRREAATIHLRQGTLCMLKQIPVDGILRETGAIFIGEGTFSFVPPIEAEQKYLKAVTKEDTLRYDFALLYLRFTDTTAVELVRTLPSTPDPFPEQLAEGLAEGGDAYNRGRNSAIAAAHFSNLVHASGDGCFYAFISDRITSQWGARPEPFTYVYDPSRSDEVRLFHTTDRGRRLVNSFSRSADYQSGIDLSRENKDVIRPLRYTIDASVRKGDLAAETRIEFQALRDSLKSLSFLLPAKQVNAVRDEAGDSLRWRHKGRTLTILFEAPLARGQETQVQVSYDRGDVSGSVRIYGGQGYYHTGKESFTVSGAIWYPTYGWRRRARFDMTFRTPKKLRVAAVGELTEERVEGDERITRWVQETPIVDATFAIGPFELHQVALEGLPVIDILHVSAGYSPEKKVAGDLANSIKFFTEVFGPFPYEKIYAVEVPYGHGISYPGLLQLSALTYTGQAIRDDAMQWLFRAHEAAHQWWGSTVGPLEVRDRWLSEGLAEYSALWYVQWITGENDLFYKRLGNWRDRLLAPHPWAPVSFGSRASNLIIYQKGAYVLHMLRNLFLDLNTMNEDAFKAVMREFYLTHRNREATTDDFKRIVEKHAGMDMGWFFDQWVYGTEIPTYRFSHKSKKTPEGKYVVHCKVKQEGVSEGFKMYVPVTIDFGNNRMARLRVMVDKLETEFDLPPLPLKPKKVIFNDFHSVLARVKKG